MSWQAECTSQPVLSARTRRLAAGMQRGQQGAGVAQRLHAEAAQLQQRRRKMGEVGIQQKTAKPAPIKGRRASPAPARSHDTVVQDLLQWVRPSPFLLLWPLGCS